jgi:hypothetical protein
MFYSAHSIANYTKIFYSEVGHVRNKTVGMTHTQHDGDARGGFCVNIRHDNTLQIGRLNLHCYFTVQTAVLDTKHDKCERPFNLVLRLEYKLTTNIVYIGCKNVLLVPETINPLTGNYNFYPKNITYRYTEV